MFNLHIADVITLGLYFVGVTILGYSFAANLGNNIQGINNYIIGNANDVKGNGNYQVTHNVDVVGDNNLLVGANHQVNGSGIKMFGPEANIPLNKLRRGGSLNYPIGHRVHGYDNIENSENIRMRKQRRQSRRRRQQRRRRQ